MAKARPAMAPVSDADADKTLSPVIGACRWETASAHRPAGAFKAGNRPAAVRAASLPAAADGRAYCSSSNIHSCMLEGAAPPPS